LSNIFSEKLKTQLGSRLGVSYLRAMQERVAISIGNSGNFDFLQSSSGVDIPGVVWDAGLYLSDFLSTISKTNGCGMTCLDIGCGTGWLVNERSRFL
jgi:2-polyprenyl-3-methyl-5-hydroxy-6-metoxy-1,4-benzoquinol methylase